MALDDAFALMPSFITDRLMIRLIDTDDAPAMFSIKSDPEVTRRYGERPHETIEQTERWIDQCIQGYAQKEVIMWTIVLRKDDSVIGSICYWNFRKEHNCAEIGYEMHRDHWGKGIMTEAMRPVLAFGFERLGLHRIEGCPLNINPPSISLLKRFGFVHEGTMRQRHLFVDTYLDEEYFSLLRDEWQQNISPDTKE